ncbi:MAG TPA: DUF4199 domain-containing protein [Chitinophagaceae bacterium]|nr:DUF4199 domain-containing protein [Chitinophagaceae bacterium]
MEPRKPMSHIVAGLLIAAIVIVISMVMMLFSKSSANPGSGWLTYLIIICGLIFFVNQYGKANNYQTSFGDLFSYGFKATAVYTILFIGFLILFSLLFPDFKTNALEAARVEIENKKGLTEEQADQGLEMMNKYFWLLAIGGTMLMFIIIGAIGSLIGAAVTKRRPQNPFDQQLP